MKIHIPFHKYQGAGNDFIIVSSDVLTPIPRNHEGNLPADWVRELCDRHFGIGADGVIEIAPLGNEQARVAMSYYNADGTPASMCGNGARCALLHATRSGMIRDFAMLETAYGSLSGCAIDPESIWILLPNVMAPTFDPVSSGWLVNTGVPHLVVETDQLDDPHLMETARAHRHRVAPEGANVDYYSVRDGKVHCRTYERGVEAETLACGTGAIAVALIAAKRHREIQSPVTVHQPGGELQVYFEESLTPYCWTLVRLFGPAKLVFSGSIAFDYPNTDRI